MDTIKIKEIIERALTGSKADVSGSEGKYSASVIFDGFEGLTTVNRHKIVYKCY